MGRSDIDLHFLIEPLPDIYAEAHFLRALAARHAVLKRILPCLGDCEVSTEAELESWYRSRPYTWYRDRGWLRLYGKECQRPVITLTDGEGRDSLLWWFFWAWERLPGFYHSGNIRTCCNLFLDMVNAYGLYIGVLNRPLRRSEVLQYWRILTPPSKEREDVWNGFHNAFRGSYRKLLPWLYRESLKLCDALYPHVAGKLEGEGGSMELRSQPPFRFSRWTYLLVNPLHTIDMSQALARMEKNTEVVVVTEKTLKLYLYHRNPWEYYTLQANGQMLPFAPPPAEALRRVVRFALHKEGPRRVGFAAGRKRDRSRAVGFEYAQCKLYVDHGVVAANAEDLVQQYRLRYGSWPYSRRSSRDAYFQHDYPLVCQTIEEISRQLVFNRAHVLSPRETDEQQ
ncbi:MAG: hypothetical protein AB7P69_26420 [Candidatus Binatia bacterium]